MSNTVYELKSFYNGKLGRVVRRIMQERIRRFWPDMNTMNMLGCGYAVPFMRFYRGDAARMSVQMMPESGAFHWPHDEKNCAFLSALDMLPIETNSVDRLLCIHGLEHAQDEEKTLRELWRVLKSNGRALIIVPNRAGLWAHADWSPYGEGRPYTMSQLCMSLKKQRFIIERSDEALFIPPLKYTPLLKMARIFENFGSKYLPIAAGVHMVEVSKQLYARVDPPKGSKVAARIPQIMMPKPTSRNSHG